MMRNKPNQTKPNQTKPKKKRPQHSVKLAAASSLYCLVRLANAIVAIDQPGRAEAQDRALQLGKN